MIKDMTKGSTFKLIFSFTIPFLIGNIIQQFYSVTSSIFVSVFVSPEALGGIGVASTIYFMVFGFTTGCCNGFCIVLAQRFGAKRKKGIKISVATSLHLYILFTIVVTVISILITKPLLIAMNTPEKNFRHAYMFAIICFCGTFSQMAYNLFSAMLRNVGDNKTPLIFLIISAAINILLDFITVAILKLGTAGAAISVVASQTLAFIPCLIFIYKKYPFMWPTKNDWRISKKYILAQIKMGLPMGLEFSVTAIGIMILQRAVNRLGENILAGFTIAMRVENLIIASFIALATAIAVYTAQNFGAKKYIRIKKGAHSTLVIGFLLYAVFSTIIFLLWDKIVNLYLIANSFSVDLTTKQQIKDAANQYINIAVLHYPILCILITFRNLVQSMGKPFIPLLTGFCELITRVIGAILLTKWFGYKGVCLSTVFTWYCAFFLVVTSYIFTIKRLLPPKQLSKNVI